jgi:hypothetical protein
MDLGFLAGASIGAIVGAVTYNPASCYMLCGPGYDAAAGGLAYGLLGTIIGGFVGARQTEDWEHVAVTARNVSLHVAPSGKAGLMVSATF